jgi:hypothetical protein
MINTPIHGKQLVKYLMQERYVSDDAIKNKPRTDAGLPGYQEGLFCMKNQTNNQELDEVYAGAVAWYIDGFTNRKNIIAKFLPGMFNVKNLESRIKKTVGYEEIRGEDLGDNIYKISYNHHIMCRDTDSTYDCVTLYQLFDSNDYE